MPLLYSTYSVYTQSSVFSSIYLHYVGMIGYTYMGSMEPTAWLAGSGCSSLMVSLPSASSYRSAFCILIRQRNRSQTMSSQKRYAIIITFTREKKLTNSCRKSSLREKQSCPQAIYAADYASLRPYLSVQPLWHPCSPSSRRDIPGFRCTRATLTVSSISSAKVSTAPFALAI